MRYKATRAKMAELKWQRPSLAVCWSNITILVCSRGASELFLFTAIAWKAY